MRSQLVTGPHTPERSQLASSLVHHTNRVVQTSLNNDEHVTAAECYGAKVAVVDCSCMEVWGMTSSTLDSTLYKIV